MSERQWQWSVLKRVPLPVWRGACTPARLAQDAVKAMRLLSAKKLFSLVLLGDPLPGHGQFFQNTALILRLSLLG